jgi:hypothetical protein
MDAQLPMKIWYVADARLPGEAANTVQIMRMAEAFARAGAILTLVARPKRGPVEEIFDFYGTERCFEMKRASRWVPIRTGRDVWNLAFSCSVFPMLWRNRRSFDLRLDVPPFATRFCAKHPSNRIPPPDQHQRRS